MKNLLVSLLFPPKCPVCREGRQQNEPLCPACQGDYEKEKRQICLRCKRRVTACQCRPRHESGAVLCYLSVFRYKESTPGGRMILRIKDGKNGPIVRLLARDMAKSLQNGCILRQDTLVTYVPRSQRSSLEKGSDQARELAREISTLCGLEMRTLIKHQAGGKEQKMLDAGSRLENAEEIYQAAKDCPDLSGRQLVLVDDVMTSGASLNACAALLKRAGADSVICLTAARR